MKKTLLLAILLLPTFTFATIDSNLKYGSRGVEVTELQEFLIDKGFLTGQPTGNFFALTKKAVISYQKSLNLPATGFVGQLTRAEINKELEVNNEAEIQETGAVNQPVSNNVDDLLKKIADLTEQQKTQQEQTNRLIESIKPEPKVGGVSIPQPIVLEDEKPQTIKVSLMFKKSDVVYLNIESNKSFTVNKLSIFQDSKFNENAPKIGSIDFQITDGVKDYVGYFNERDNLDIYINHFFKDGKASIRMPVGYGGKYTAGQFTDENRAKGHKIILKSGDSEIIGVNGDKLTFEDIEIIIN